MKQKQNWQIKTEDGRTVKVKYTSRYFSKDSICHHLEFRGYAVSETSYRSHFFGPIGEGVKDTSLTLKSSHVKPPSSELAQNASA